MREKLAAQFPASDIWDIKFAPGGLVDIEFIAQAFQLREASSNPGVLDQNTIAALEKLMQSGRARSCRCGGADRRRAPGTRADASASHRG